MSFTRRTFLTGAASGLSVLVLSACTPQDPGPTPTPTPTPTPSPMSGVPAPAALVRSRWGSDQFARGAYSYVAVGSSPEQRAALRTPVGERVFFAGEATSDDDPGTVGGAIESGVRAAAEVQAATAGPERVAVIGAGAAGATAARRLAEYGHTVTLIEARDRIGGRISTVSSDEWPVPVELGAAWVRGRGAESLSAVLDRLEVDARDVPPVPLLVTSDGEGAEPDPVGEQAVRTALEWAAGRPTDVSLEDALRESGAGELSGDGQPSQEDRLAAYLRERVALPLGASTADLSSWYASLDSPGTGGRLVLGGFDRLVADLVDGLDVWLSTPVTTVSYSEEGVSLRLGTGEAVSVDRAVVTVPLGVLQNQGLTFDPALPFAQRTAVAELGVGVADLVWVRFDEAFWDSDAVLWSVLGGGLPIADWVNLRPLTGDPVLVGLVGAEAAESLAELEDDALLTAVVSSLAPFAAAGE
ncbi:NAD(P)/FAD-dependent oxidoreductase [Naasia sp. SYSU D00948]|uniref:flavin monoamine oxidase family protein n=1 Tax=Naasia sp. SYSU D00948 TaxID=2817379 RepID=UPI001B30C8B3|nr:NAD(P)/FAD-dependent oxidoreductase [Naasia sp. SYSU D00948]